MHVYDGTLLVFLAVACMVLERPWLSIAIGGAGFWLVAH